MGANGTTAIDPLPQLKYKTRILNPLSIRCRFGQRR